MSYVDAFVDRANEIVRVVERDKKGQRIFKTYPIDYSFYVKDPRGKYTSIYGEPLRKVVCKNSKDLRKEIAIAGSKNVYESDLNPAFVCLSSNYLGKDAPKLNVAFFDIETDFSHERGYSSPEEAFLPITSIAVYLQWLETLVCLAVPPKTLTMEQAEEQVKQFPNTHLFETEAEMLKVFLDLIEDADILSAWNGEGFDVPYTVNRVVKTLSKDDSRRFCLFDQFPKKREYEKYGKQSITYDLVGRVHMDYLELYRKFTYEERHSYSLDAISEYELGERKTAYTGTLDQLYNNDFALFIEYNRQDTMLLDKLDKKLKFMDLANTYAHENTVLLPTVMGAVAATEQAIINEAHRRGMIVYNRIRLSDNENTQAAGAYVAYPKKGLHDWIGSLDINSLYPSTIRALNMSPETIIGQLRQTETDSCIAAEMAKGKSFAAAWEGKFGSVEYEYVINQKIGNDVTIDWENGTSDTLSGAQAYQLIFESNQPWTISANGTIFTYEKEGVIPGLLKKWYADRKEMQKILKNFIDLKYGIEVPDRFKHLDTTNTTNNSDVTDFHKLNWEEFFSTIENAGESDLLEFAQCRNLEIKNGKIYAKNKDQVELAEEYWDKLQSTRKLNLNSLYGSILNAGCRFFDKRIGQSTTLTGRQVVKHMSAEVNKIITGVKDYRGESVLYNDSVTGDTLINTSQGIISIEHLFNQCQEVESVTEKEYAVSDDIRVLGYNSSNANAELTHFNYVMRHKTTKNLYLVELSNGKNVKVTEDHSVMVIRNGILCQAKPQEILDSDQFVSASNPGEVSYASVKKVTDLGLINDYVYDVSVTENNPYFFGNDILLHNTDSALGSTVHVTNRGNLTVEDLFEQCEDTEVDTKTGKEYAYDDELMVLTYDEISKQPYMGHINYIYRHKVTKDLYEIEDADGNIVTVTEDHSVMVERDGELIEVKPYEITETDVLVSIEIK